MGKRAIKPITNSLDGMPYPQQNTPTYKFAKKMSPLKQNAFKDDLKP